MRVVVHGSTLPEDRAWLTAGADEAALRERFDRPLSLVAALRPPPLLWVTDIWPPSWNADHPDKPCASPQAMTLPSCSPAPRGGSRS